MPSKTESRAFILLTPLFTSHYHYTILLLRWFLTVRLALEYFLNQLETAMLYSDEPEIQFKQAQDAAMPSLKPVCPGAKLPFPMPAATNGLPLPAIYSR